MELAIDKFTPCLEDARTGAVTRSVEEGNNGYLFLDAKNTKLVQHYQDRLGAKLLGQPHPYRMEVEENDAMQLLQIYTLEAEQ